MSSTATAASAATTTSAVEVRFAAGRRPEDATHVRLDAGDEEFDGPIALLLSLIEQRELDVLTVSLGDLCGAYLDAIVQLDDGRLPMLSSFVTVASQLILIKSRAMLPRAPAPSATADGEGTEADPEEELRRRLIEYRLYRDAGRALGERLAAGHALYHREAEAALAAGKAGAQPEVVQPLPVQVLVDALAAALRIVPPPPLPPETVARTITLEDRALIIRAALRDAPAFVLQELLGDVRDRIVIAITFLAMLEMAKGREVTIEQAVPWGPISVRSVGEAP